MAFLRLSGSWMIWTILSSARLVLCPPSLRKYVFFPFHFPFLFSHTFLHMVILNCDDYVRVQLVLLSVVLLPLPFYLGRSMLMALMVLLRSNLWDVTRMSWVIVF